jgi:hypothetical protein
MDRVCSTNGREEECVYDIGMKSKTLHVLGFGSVSY